jgi:hypothetical protein
MVMILVNQKPMNRSIRMEVYLECISRKLDGRKRKKILALIQDAQKSSSGTEQRVIFEGNRYLIIQINIRNL